jgi:hypothetical protein
VTLKNEADFKLFLDPKTEWKTDHDLNDFIIKKDGIIPFKYYDEQRLLTRVACTFFGKDDYEDEINTLK